QTEGIPALNTCRICYDPRRLEAPLIFHALASRCSHPETMRNDRRNGMTRSPWFVATLISLTLTVSARAAEPIRLELDATEAGRSLFHGKLHVPVQAGAVTLVYPKWIPGEHGPTGPITDFSGLVVSGGGKTIPWRRDAADMYAFHIDVPQGVN